jgi:hypothetical protein
MNVLETSEPILRKVLEIASTVIDLYLADRLY